MNRSVSQRFVRFCIQSPFFWHWSRLIVFNLCFVDLGELKKIELPYF